MTISMEDRSALLSEGVVVHSVHQDSLGTRIYATSNDAERATEAITARLGEHVKVSVCGETPREVRPRRSSGHMEREEGRLQLRYELLYDEHLDEILFAEDDERVVIFGMVCSPVDAEPGPMMGSPSHIYLDRPLGKRTVFDAVAGAPVPYFNVYDGIEERVAGRQRARRRGDA
jgi:hypothetical protein